MGGVRDIQERPVEGSELVTKICTPKTSHRPSSGSKKTNTQHVSRAEDNRR